MRALRWRILLNATATLSVGEVYWANMAGYFGNQYLPARAGELIRTVLISNRSPLSKTYVFTTALSERLMDVIALVLGSSIVLLGVNPKPSWMQDLSKTMAIVAGAGAIAIMVIPHTGGLLERLIDRMPLPERIRKIAQVLAEQILSGHARLSRLGPLCSLRIPDRRDLGGGCRWRPWPARNPWGSTSPSAWPCWC